MRATGSRLRPGPKTTTASLEAVVVFIRGGVEGILRPWHSELARNAKVRAHGCARSKIPGPERAHRKYASGGRLRAWIQGRAKARFFHKPRTESKGRRSPGARIDEHARGTSPLGCGRTKSSEALERLPRTERSAQDVRDRKSTPCLETGLFESAVLSRAQAGFAPGRAALCPEPAH